VLLLLAPCLVDAYSLLCIVVAYSGIYFIFPCVVATRFLPCVVVAHSLPYVVIAYSLPCVIVATCWGVVLSPSFAMCKVKKRGRFFENLFLFNCFVVLF
jgi:hypothetical protein